MLPVRNEARHIASTLEAVLSQDYEAERMEILVSDGISEDGTREIVRAIQETDCRVQLIDNPGKIVPTGMNAALRASRGDIIVRVDGHTVIAPDYVRACVEELERTGADNVGGRMNPVGEGSFGEAVAAATSSPFAVGGARFHYSDREEWVDTVYLGAWRREVFDRIGLFDEEMVRSQDSELNYRLLKHGGRILLSPRIRSTYTVRSKPGGLWRQYFQYGVWKSRVLQKHPRQMRLRQFVAPSFVLSLLVAAMLIPVWLPSAYVLAAVAGSYLLADLAASVQTAARTRWRLIALLPLVFAMIHFSWGLGFLSGLVRFRRHWREAIVAWVGRSQAGVTEGSTR